MLEAKKSATITEKKLCSANKKSLDEVWEKSKDQQESISIRSKFINHKNTDLIAKSMENNFSAQNCRRRLSFTEVTG